MRRYSDDLGLLLVVLVIALTAVFLLGPIVVSAAMSLDSRSFLGPCPPPRVS